MNMMSEEDALELYHQMCSLMLINTDEWQMEYDQASENDKEQMLKTKRMVLRNIRLGRLTIEDGIIVYALAMPLIRLDKSEVHTISFNLEKTKTGKLMSAIANKNLSNAEMGMRWVSALLGMSTAELNNIMFKDFSRLGEIAGFFVAS